MHEDAHCTLTTLHDLGDLGHPEVGDDTEEHGFGLVGWQRPDEGECVFERRRPLGLLVGSRRRGPVGLGLLIGLVLRSSLRRTDVVDPASGSDREEPSPEIGLVTLEAVEPRGDFDPHDRGEILRVAHPFAAEVAEEEVLVRAPELAERLGISVPRASDHVLHGS